MATELENENDDTPIGKQATGKQLAAIVFVLALAAKMFLLPIFLVRATGRDAFIALSVNIVLDLTALALFIIAIAITRDGNFFELLARAFGKIGAKTVAAAIGLFMFLKLNVSVSEILFFYGTDVLTDFDSTLMMIVLLIFLAAAAHHTLKALCRLNELLLPLIVLCITVLIAIVIMTGMDMGNILPSLQDPARFGDAVLRHASWTGDFTPLVLFIGRTEIKKRTVVATAAAGVIGSVVALFFALVMSAAFGNVPMLADDTTNLSSILQFTLGNVYGRIDMFASILWSVAVFIQAALLFYCVCRFAAFVVGKNSRTAIALCVSIALYVTQVFGLVDRTIFSAAIVSIPCSAIAAGFTVLTPVIAIVCAASARKAKSGGRVKA